MKRALLVALAGLAMPAAALAQSAGAINLPTGFTSINLAQCDGAQNPIIGNDKLTVDLTWNVKPQTTFSLSGTISVYALKEQPGAGQTTGDNLTSCLKNSSNAAIAPVPIAVPDTDGTSVITPSAQTMTDTFSLQKIVSSAGIDCSVGSGTVYLCVQWDDGSTIDAGFAVATVKLDTTPPTKPSSVSWTPGDSTLHVKAHVDSTTSSCKAIATSSADPGDHSSGEDACDTLTITNLKNLVDYQVVVYAIDAANNPSDASDPVTATPYPTQDFWDHYKADNGRETGGCSTAAGGAGLLLSLLGLLAVRRRKP